MQNTQTLSRTRLSRRPASPAQAGFSLLEALICVVLIAFAFLGSAGLHLASLRDTQSSGQVAQAAQLATEMAERVRVNFRNTANYTSLAAAARANCNTTTACSPTEMVENDLAEWQAALASKLPGGLGVVCRDSSPNDGAGPASAACTGGATDPIAVKVWWTLRDSASAGGPIAATQRQVLPFIPRP